MFRFEPNITVGNIVEFLVLAGAIFAYYRGWFAWQDKTTSAIERMQEEIRLLRDNFEKLSSIVITEAEQNVRISNNEKRIDRLDKLVDDLRRGEGMILPISLPHGRKPHD